MPLLRLLIVLSVFRGTVAYSQPSPTYIIVEEGRIGSLENDDSIFGLIRGVEVDSKGRVHVLDGIRRDIRRFSSAGQLERLFNLTTGSGPGEFQMPWSFALSEDEHKYYVWDQEERRISLLDVESGAFLGAFTVSRGAGLWLRGHRDGTVAATFAQRVLPPEGHIVRVFSEEGEELNSFGEKHPLYYEYLNADLQDFREVSLAYASGRWFLSFALPYEIRSFDESGTPLSEISRDVDFFGSTYEEGEWTFPTGVGRSVFVPTPGVLAHAVEDRRAGRTLLILYDFEGKRLGELPLSGSGTNKAFFFPSATDGAGLVYGLVSEPFPQLIRFSFGTRSGD
ncbi:MAG: hypothetical protein JJ896_11465 [Rhodothermales bacterium]|nr:hypothetical protein [Rhodothermales bacterium]MBO6780261.1 hypothetical protein [Rhodothermales bacterium]